MGKRELRQNAIRALVRRYPIHTQQEIADHLKKQGFECTQATVSRDIIELGLVKNMNKCYSAPEDLRLQRLLADMVVSVRKAMNIVVIHTMDGAAAGVAGALDKASVAEVLGTVAGDDTIFVVCQDETSAERLVRSLGVLRR